MITKVNEPINALEKRDIQLDLMPRFALARMLGNHMSLGELMFARCEVPEDYYDTDTKIRGDYPVPAADDDNG